MLPYYKSVITGELLVLESSHWYQMKSIRFDGAFAEDQDKKKSGFMIYNCGLFGMAAVCDLPSAL